MQSTLRKKVSGFTVVRFVIASQSTKGEKTKLDNKIMQLEKEQAIFKKDRIRAERKIAANREDMTKAESAAARMTQDWEYITSYTGDRTTRLLNLAQATAEETGRELHRISKTYRNGAIGTIGTYAGLNLSVYSEYDMGGTFYRNTFLVEGVSGLKYRCGISGALPLASWNPPDTRKPPSPSCPA